MTEADVIDHANDEIIATVQADTAGGTGHMGAETKYLVASSNFSDSVNIQDE